LSNLSFLLSLKYKVFCIQICTLVVYIADYIQIYFFRFFLKLLNVDFEKI
jgi:hypothetical protein